LVEGYTVVVPKVTPKHAEHTARAVGTTEEAKQPGVVIGDTACRLSFIGALAVVAPVLLGEASNEKLDEVMPVVGTEVEPVGGTLGDAAVVEEGHVKDVEVLMSVRNMVAANGLYVTYELTVFVMVEL